MDRSTWRQLTDAELNCVCVRDGYSVATAPSPKWIMPGSFNPLHQGHRAIADWVRSHVTDDQVMDFEISIENVDKPRLVLPELQQRLAQFAANDKVWVTRAASFLRKATLFPGATFVVGADTLQRVADPRYYDDGAAGVTRLTGCFTETECRFLVFGRVLHSKFYTLPRLDIPDDVRRLCQGIPESAFRLDISSTSIRSQSPDPPS